MVEDGWNISEAVPKFGISKTTFYNNITKEQRVLLGMAKTLNTKYGAGSRGSSIKIAVNSPINQL